MRCVKVVVIFFLSVIKNRKNVCDKEECDVLDLGFLLVKKR